MRVNITEADAAMMAGVLSRLKKLKNALFSVQVGINPSYAESQSQNNIDDFARYRAAKLSYKHSKKPYTRSEILAIADQRDRFRQETARELKDLNGATPQIGVNFTWNGRFGQYGKLALMIKGLLSMYPKLKFEVRNKDQQTNLGDMFGINELDGKVSTVKGLYTSSKFDDVIVTSEGVAIVQESKIVDPDIYGFLPLAAVNGASIDSSKILIDDDQSNPYSTLILDPSLRENQKNRDQWSKEEVIVRREAWMLENLTLENRKVLLDLSFSEGWEAEKSVWSFLHSYNHTNSFLIHEFNEMAKYLPDRIYEDQGKQILIFASEISFSDYQLIIGQGIEVIHKGVRYPVPKGVKRLPITLIIQDINNNAARSLVSELSGTLKRSADDRSWVNVPLYVTGNASWMEAISAGVPWIHDDIDANLAKEKDIKDVLRRYLYLSQKEKRLKSLISGLMACLNGCSFQVLWIGKMFMGILKKHRRLPGIFQHRCIVLTVWMTS